MTNKRLEAKRNHHHVWADYLKRWSPNEKDIYYSTAKGKIAFDSVKAITVTRDFYQLRHLNEAHIEIIKKLSSHSPTHLQELHISYLSDFLHLQNLKAIYENGPITYQELDKEIYALKCNLLENLHSAHENEAQVILSSLANRKIDVLYDEEKMLLFMQFMGHQITRTKTLKDTVFSTQFAADNTTGMNIGKHMDECWWFISYMLGMNLGWSLYQSRKEDNHCLLLNDTEIPFITSDQPIINVYKSLEDNEISPPPDEHCDLYYPISPWVAYMINKSDRFQKGINHISADAANELNIKIARRANIHIVSNSESSLESLLKHIGQHFKNLHRTYNT